MQIFLNPILVRNLGLSQGSSNTPKPAPEKKKYVQDASQWKAPSTGKAPTNAAEAKEAGGLTPGEAQTELRNLAAQREQEDKLQEKMQYGSWSQADIDQLMKNGGETWWRDLPSTGEEEMDRLQAQFIAGMDTFYDEDQTRKATAAGYEANFKTLLSQPTSRSNRSQLTTCRLLLIWRLTLLRSMHSSRLPTMQTLLKAMMLAASRQRCGTRSVR